MEKIRTLLVRVVLLGQMLVSTFALANAEVLHHLEEVSRDNYYVHIDDTETPFRVRDIVGGEHENLYHILGFQGESFVIVFQSPDGKASYSVRGEGFELLEGNKGDLVTVEDLSTWISINVWAHPDTAEYLLTVKKHEFGPQDSAKLRGCTLKCIGHDTSGLFNFNDVTKSNRTLELICVPKQLSEIGSR